MHHSRLTPAALLAALAACSGVLSGGAKDAARVDPLTADAAAIKAAVTLPEGLKLRPDQALLNVETAQGDVRLAESFRLQLTQGADGRVTLLSLAPQDVERFRDWQTRALDLRQTGPAPSRMSISLGACATGAGPAADAIGSLGLRLQAGAPMAPVIDEAPLATLLGPDNLAAIGPCP